MSERIYQPAAFMLSFPHLFLPKLPFIQWGLFRGQESSDIVQNNMFVQRLEVLDNKMNNLNSNFNSISTLIGSVRTRINTDAEKVYNDVNSLRNAFIREMDLHCLRLYESCNTAINVITQNAVTWDQRLQLTRGQIETLHREIAALNGCTAENSEYKLQELEGKIAKETQSVSILIEMFENQYNHRMQLIPKYDLILPKLSGTMKELTITQNNNYKRDVKCIHSNIDRIILVKVLELQVQRQYETNELRGCTVLSSGELVFADHGNNRLLIFTRDGQLKGIITLAGNPFSVTALQDHKLAVTFHALHILQILDLKDNSSRPFRELEAPCTGVSYSEQKIAVRIEGFGFHIIDSISLETTHRIAVEGKSISYVSICGERLYYANWDSGKVTCCDINGKQLWELKNIMLQSPNGITTDSFGNVFITGYSSNNILIIARDGLTAKLVDSSFFSLSMPVAIHYDTDSNALLVTTATGLAFLYKVERT